MIVYLLAVLIATIGAAVGLDGGTINNLVSLREFNNDDTLVIFFIGIMKIIVRRIGYVSI